MESHLEAVMSECVNGVDDEGQEEPAECPFGFYPPFLQVRVVVMVRIYM